MKVEHARNVRRLVLSLVDAGELSQASDVAEAFAVEPESPVNEVHLYADLLMAARQYKIAYRLLCSAARVHGQAINDHKRETAYWLSKTPDPMRTIRGGAALWWCLENLIFRTVLDIGSGGGAQAAHFSGAEKHVTAIDLGRSKYFEGGAPYERCTLVRDDFNDWNSSERFELVWASHILEHQRNVGDFLDKCWSHTKDDGWLAITVPPLKHEIVGGHLSVWNAGLIIYNLVIGGNDCSEAVIMNYDYNISVIVKKNPINLPDLDNDIGDIERISMFLPKGFRQNFDGRMYGYYKYS